MRVRSPLRLIAAALTIVVLVAACGDSNDTPDAAASSSGSGSAALTNITIGYSAWPGWFPLAVAEEKGIFAKHGLDVDLKYFADYVTSLDAMSAGKLDVNAQTLNDTMLAVAQGGKQTIVVVNDNSTGNDQIICDKSITSIEGMRGKTVAAEAGVVDHFLLLQGLESKGMTEDDVDFRGVLTGDAAAGFANGEFDCVGVFAPFTLEAAKRPGSHVLFDSSDYPGTIPDHLVVDPKLITGDAEAVQSLVDAWYETLDYLKSNPDDATAIMADKAELSAADYEQFADGTTLFTVQQAVAAFTESDEPTSLLHTAKLINPFLVTSGLATKEASLTGLFDDSFTKHYADSHPG